MTTTSKPRGWLRAVWGWDLAVSILLSVALLAALLASSRPLEDASGAIYAAIPYGVGIALGGLVASRWLTDRLKDDPYGALLRVVDPDESKSQAPFTVVILAGLTTSFTGLVLVLVKGELSRTLTSITYALLFFFALYSLLGMADLVRISRRHQRRQARLRAIREMEQRRREE